MTPKQFLDQIDDLLRQAKQEIYKRAGRLLGWIKSPKEACDEMGIDMITAQRAFNCNRVFAASEYKLLTA